MKKLMTVLMISGVAVMAQTGGAPASSTNTNGSTNPAPTTKVRKHHKKAKDVTPNANPTGSASTNTTTNKPASK